MIDHRSEEFDTSWVDVDAGLDAVLTGYHRWQRQRTRRRALAVLVAFVVVFSGGALLAVNRVQLDAAVQRNVTTTTAAVSTPTTSPATTTTEPATTTTVTPTTVPATTIATTTTELPTTTAATSTSVSAAGEQPRATNAPVVTKAPTTVAVPATSAAPPETVAATTGPATTPAPRAQTTSTTCAGEKATARWTAGERVTFTVVPAGASVSGAGTDAARATYQRTLDDGTHECTVTARYQGETLSITFSDLVLT